MLSNTSALLDRINLAINKKCRKDTGIPEIPPNSQIAKTKENQITGNYFNRSASEMQAERLEIRIRELESQCDQLLCFVNSFIDKFPDMVINIIHSEWKSCCDLAYEFNKLETTKISLKTFSCHENNLPYPTRREMDVIELLTKGFCAKEIANKLFISETTVITHKKNLKEKFNAKNTAELISKVQHFLPGENNM